MYQKNALSTFIAIVAVAVSVVGACAPVSASDRSVRGSAQLQSIRVASGEGSVEVPQIVVYEERQNPELRLREKGGANTGDGKFLKNDTLRKINEPLGSQRPGHIPALGNAERYVLMAAGHAKAV